MQPGEFKVDFIGIGAMRSGTTWIAKCLSDHPEICFSTPKETDFFNKDYNFSRGLPFYRDFFRNCQGLVKGEFTTSYYLNGQTAKRIAALFPNVKILVSLRNPVDRAFSHYQFMKEKGKEQAGSFEEGLEKNNIYLEAGFYARHLREFLAVFPRQNTIVMIYEDCFTDPFGFMRKIYRFLGVDDKFASKYAKQLVNQSQTIRYRSLFFNRLINKRKAVKEFWPGRAFIGFLKFFGVNALIKFLLRLNQTRMPQRSVKEKPTLETRIRLQNIYAEDTADLEKYLGRDLSVWKN